MELESLVWYLTCVVYDWPFVGCILVQVLFLVLVHKRGKTLGMLVMVLSCLSIWHLHMCKGGLGFLNLGYFIFEEFVFVFVENVFVGCHFVGFVFAGYGFDCSVHGIGGSGSG